MYGLSPETDLSPLNGCTLTFVGFGQYQVQLAFSGDTDCAISIEGDYVVTPSGGESTTFTGAVDGAPAVLPLLGHTVAVAEVPTDGTVRVAFDDGCVVDVLDSQAHYESYQVNLGERLLVV
jgi:hypothetical protein